MQLYLSSVFEHSERFFKKHTEVFDLPNLYILQSFAYAKDKDAEYYPLCKGFLMDSGAFTIMHSKNTKDFDIKDFTKRYGNFIKKHNVKDFLELDVDSVFGIDVYQDCMKMLQDITGRDPIRVLHNWRGREYFEELVKVKDRICTGGVAKGSSMQFGRTFLHDLVKIAHENNCKVHGLGVTDPSVIRECNFDSVDSSSWTSGIRFGTLYRFDGHSMQHYDSSRNNCPPGKQIARKCSFMNAVNEWSKYVKYLDSDI